MRAIKYQEYTTPYSLSLAFLSQAYFFFAPPDANYSCMQHSGFWPTPNTSSSVSLTSADAVHCSPGSQTTPTPGQIAEANNVLKISFVQRYKKRGHSVDEIKSFSHFLPDT